MFFILVKNEVQNIIANTGFLLVIVGEIFDELKAEKGYVVRKIRIIV